MDFISPDSLADNKTHKIETRNPWQSLGKENMSADLMAEIQAMQNLGERRRKQKASVSVRQGDETIEDISTNEDIEILEKYKVRIQNIKQFRAQFPGFKSLKNR